jgi:hypothetical protein
VVTDLLSATLGGVAGGRWIARAAGVAILVLGVFAALDQLQIAPAIVTGLFYAMLAIIVGVTIVAFGVGGIQTARGYWERAAGRMEAKDREIQRSGRTEASRGEAQPIAGGAIAARPEPRRPDPPPATPSTGR